MPYLMKIENNYPFLRNGTTTWTRPVMDEKDNFFPSLSSVKKKYDIPCSSLSQSLHHGTALAGHQFRFAGVDEVQAYLGDKVLLHSGERVKKPKGKRTKGIKAKGAGKGKVRRATKKSKTIYIDGPGDALDPTKGAALFEGHVFTGGPAVLILPGTSFRMERPTRDDFPTELRDACRWN